MPDFDVGNPGLQDLLEWVDQPPPQQGRDTHALSVFLQKFDEDSFIYGGLLFFRPGNPTSPSFQQQPGLSGILRPLLTLTPGEAIDDTVLDHFSVRIELRFRPPRVFAALFFLEGGFLDLPGEPLRDQEFLRVEVGDRPRQHGGGIIIRLFTQNDPPRGWVLADFDKTTVLYGHP